MQPSQPTHADNPIPLHVLPQVPYLRAPYFVWLGRPWSDAQKQLHHEQKVEAPAMFPPTFLYTQSWEDPEPDMKVRFVLVAALTTVLYHLQGPVQAGACAIAPLTEG